MAFLQQCSGVLNQYTTFLSTKKQLATFRQKVAVGFEAGSFVVKTAENWTDLKSVLRLRYHVFQKEYCGVSFPLEFDVDKLDVPGDHLMVIEKETGKMVGTYRLLMSDYTDSYYAQSEFHLGQVLAIPGTKVELSRAAVAQGYRTGPVIQLLWRGLAEYIKSVDAKFLFGCASIQITDSVQAALIYRVLQEKGYQTEDWGVTPNAAYQIPRFSEFLEAEFKAARSPLPKVTELTPPLFQAYLKAGAQMCGKPALDRIFRCIDFFTLLNLDELSPALRRRFLGGQTAA